MTFKHKQAENRLVEQLIWMWYANWKTSSIYSNVKPDYLEFPQKKNLKREFEIFFLGYSEGQKVIVVFLSSCKMSKQFLECMFLP